MVIFVYGIGVMLAGALMGRLTHYAVQLTPGLPGYLLIDQKWRPERDHGDSRPGTLNVLSVLAWRHRYGLSCMLVFAVVVGNSPTEGLFCALMYSWFLVTLAWTDYYTLLLPDRITLPFLLFGVIAQLTAAGHMTISPSSCLLGALYGGGGLLMLDRLYERVRGHVGIGGGDIKLMAGLGAWLGWQALPALCCGASLTGLTWYALAAPSSRKIAFGPCLALAGWLGYLRV
ncbi:A24 family peptidase [Acerihabitans sp. TG2]|uniref:prepilin peptidase n=1 Tax=Acerihabitans sp. TG2 TaxID=3096008 RepID=UPI002B2300C9|nr:A24 family peptidase [Acerihabitans sp. TG2]MEA9393330.1 A24 family peptidase [Acerihabitans sp. TG2]